MERICSAVHSYALIRRGVFRERLIYNCINLQPPLAKDCKTTRLSVCSLRRTTTRSPTAKMYPSSARNRIVRRVATDSLHSDSVFTTRSPTAVFTGCPAAIPTVHSSIAANPRCSLAPFTTDLTSRIPSRTRWATASSSAVVRRTLSPVKAISAISECAATSMALGTLAIYVAKVMKMLS